MKPELEREFLVKFEKNINEVLQSKISFKAKIDKISWLLQSEAEYWNRKGDDGTLSRMTSFCGSAVTQVAQEEIQTLKKSEKLEDIKKKEFSDLDSQIKAISWLPEGFKSSLGLEISFAISELRYKKPF